MSWAAASVCLESGPLRHVDHDIELVLVVEREHLERHSMREYKPHGKSHKYPDQRNEPPSKSSAFEHGVENSAIALKKGVLLQCVGFMAGWS